MPKRAPKRKRASRKEVSSDDDIRDYIINDKDGCSSDSYK